MSHDMHSIFQYWLISFFRFIEHSLCKSTLMKKFLTCLDRRKSGSSRGEYEILLSSTSGFNSYNTFSVATKKNFSLMENQPRISWKMISMKSITLIFRLSNTSPRKDFSIYLGNFSLPNSVSFGMIHQIKPNALYHWERKLDNHFVPNRKVFYIDEMEI